jgi:hypothetical protein
MSWAVDSTEKMGRRPEKPGLKYSLGMDNLG